MMETERKLNIREKFGTLFAQGGFQKLYDCVSEEFKRQVSLQQFLEQSKLFNQGEQFYRLETNLYLTPQIEQFIWINSTQTKAISVMFDEHNIIQALVLAPIESFSERERWSANKYTMPIQSEWFVYWGGKHEALNYHHPVENQRYAYDLVVRKGKKSYKNDGMKNEDYYAYGKKVVAPLKGVVVSAADGQEDNEIGHKNKENPLGNYVIIEHEGKEYSVLAHLKKGSVSVKKETWFVKERCLEDVEIPGIHPNLTFIFTSWMPLTSKRQKVYEFSFMRLLNRFAEIQLFHFSID